MSHRLADPTDPGKLLLVVAGNRLGLNGQLRQAFGASARLVSDAAIAPTGRDGKSGVLGPGLSTIGSAAAALVPGLASIVQAVELGKQAADIGKNVADRRSNPSSRVNPKDYLMQTLAGLAGAGPAVVLLENLEQDPDLWELVSYIIRHEPASLHHLPVAIVASVDGPVSREDRGRPAGEGNMSWGQVVGQAIELCESGAAQWVYLPPLTASEAQDWLGPVESSLLELFISLSGGDDAVAGELWSTWRALGYVQLGTSGWHIPAGAREPLGMAVLEVLRSRVPGLADKARTAVNIAALFGVEFSQSVVARVAADELGIEPSAVVDLLDELTPDGDLPWLIETVSHVSHHDGDHWRYRFASPLVARYLRAATDGTLLQRLFDETMVIHGDDEDYLDDLARLAQETGRGSLARDLHARIAVKLRKGRLQIHALVLLATTEQLPGESAVLDDLLATTVDLYLTGADSALAADVGQRAVTIARTHDLMLAEALFVAGRASVIAGRGLGLLKESVTHDRAVYGADPTPGNRWALAEALNELGRESANAAAAGGMGMLEEALTHLRHLYGAAPTVRNQQALAIAVYDLGRRLADGADRRRGLVLLNEALGHARQFYDSAPTPRTQRDLALILQDVGERLDSDPERALSLLQEALARMRSAYAAEPTSRNERTLTVVLRYLGARLAEGTDPVGGIELIEEHLKHDRHLFDVDATPANRWELAITLHELGRRLADSADLPRGLNLLGEALTHGRLTCDSHPTADNVRELAITLRELGWRLYDRRDALRGTQMLEEAVTLQRHLYDDSPTRRNQRELALTLTELGLRLPEGTDSRRKGILFEEALAHFRQLFDVDPTPQERRDLAVALVALGRHQLNADAPVLGLAMLEEALTHFRRLYRANPKPRERTDLADTLKGLSRRLIGSDPVRSADLLEEASRLRQP